MTSDIQVRTSAMDCVPLNTPLRIGSGEQSELAGLRSPKRQRDYMAGRLLGKRLLSDMSGESPNNMEILSRDSNQKPTRPRVYLSGRPTGWRISISHNSKRVMVAATMRSAFQIGCDLETVALLGNGFQEMWFTESERNWLKNPDAPGASVLWAAKEASYKAMNQGEKFMPRRFEVQTKSENRWRCEYGTNASPRVCQLEVIEMNQEVAIIAAYQT